MRRIKRAKSNGALCSAAFSIILCGWIFIGLLAGSIGFASQEVIYKAPMGKKELLKNESASENLIQTETRPKNLYIYDPTGKTDPFKSFIAEQESVEEKKKRKPKTYLETLDLSQLDLVAIILSRSGNWAMVRDSKGLGYVITKGTPIGINEGVVHEIKDKEVIVREQYKDLRQGQLKYKDTAKKLLTLQ
jgi:Tfp pilus assembly protein PilP